MPLILLGLLLITGILIYAAVNRSYDESDDVESVRDRYSRMFEDKAKDAADELSRKIRNRAGIHDADFTVEDDGYGGSDSDKDESDNTIKFPSDVESEKRKRDIH